MDSITSENITNEFLAFNQSQWTSNGSNIYLNSSVGIGTSLPRANLDVYGTGRFGSSLSVSGNLTVSNLIVTGNLVNVVSNTQFSNSVTINNAGTSTALKVVQLENVPVHTNNVAEFWDYQTLALLINGDGNVGIHTTLINPYSFAVVGSSNLDYINTINVYSSNAVAASNLYGNVVGSNTVSASRLYGQIVGSNTVSASGLYGPVVGANTITGTTISGSTLYGPLAGSNTIVGSTIYGPIAGSNTISASTIYGQLAGSNTIAGSTVTANAYWSSTPFFFRNRLINGDFYIDQRNAGSATTPTGTINVIDRWKWNMNAGETGRVQLGKNLSGFIPPTGFQSYLGLKTTTTAAVGTADYYFLSQVIEGINTLDIMWGSTTARPLTLSFWVQSTLSGTYGGFVRNPASFSNSYTFTYTINSINTWEYKTMTIPGPTIGTWPKTQTDGIEFGFTLGNGTTYQVATGSWANGNFTGPSGTLANFMGTLNATWFVTGVQVEMDTVATPFERRLYPIELQLCQRYYEIYMVRVGGYHTTGGGLRGSAYFRAQKRQVTPVNTIIGSALESVNLGTPNIDTSNFTGDSVRYIVAVTATGDAYGQWKYSTDCEF